MATLTYCKSCNAAACQSCNSCEKCNSRCQVTCNKKQVFCNVCQTFSEAVGKDFSWSKCAVKNESIAPGYFDKDVWDEIIKYINKARKKGIKQSTGNTISISTKDAVDPFSANEFNRVATSVNYDNSNIKSDKVIYGSYFSDLANAASRKNISSSACDTCNAKCDGGCNACQSCNTKCNGCNSETTHGSYCCSCNTCQHCNTCQGCNTCQSKCQVKKQT